MEFEKINRHMMWKSKNLKCMKDNEWDLGWGPSRKKKNLETFEKKSQVLGQGLPNFEHLPLQMAK
jgi:hypothetical protein